MRLMLSGRALKCVRSLKRIRPRNLHLPPVTGLRAYDHDPPVPRSIRKDVFDDRSHVPLRLRVAAIVHFHHHCHTKSVRQAIYEGFGQAGERSRIVHFLMRFTQISASA